jgi:hypothetical protein
LGFGITLILICLIVSTNDYNKKIFLFFFG